MLAIMAFICSSAALLISMVSSMVPLPSEFNVMRVSTLIHPTSTPIAITTAKLTFCLMAAPFGSKAPPVTTRRYPPAKFASLTREF